MLSGTPIEAFDDVTINLISLGNVLDALVDIGEARTPGLYQLSGPSDETYYTIALALADRLRVPRNLVRRASAATAGVPESFRPRHASLRQTLPKPIRVPDLVELLAISLAPR